MRNTQITEDDLSELVLCCFRVDTGYIVYTAVELCIRIIFKRRIYQTGIKTELSSVARYLQHIINVRIDIAVVYRIGSVGKLLNKLLLKRGSFNLNYLIITVRHIKFQRVRSTNVSHLLEHTHQFGQTYLETLQTKCFCKADFTHTTL